MTTTTPTDIEALCERAMNSVARIATVQNAPAQVWQAHVLAVTGLATTLRATAAERDEAHAEIERWNSELNKAFARAESAEADRDRLSARVGELERLLDPFAKFAEVHDGPHGLQPDLGGDYVWLCPSPGYPKITTDQFRAARDFLATKEKPDAE